MEAKARGHKLIDAIFKDKSEEALKILQQPVDFSIQQSGDNAIHMAARKGRLDIIKAMVDKGADIRQKNQNGNTAAHYAAKAGFLDILQYLRSQRVDLNVGNNDGNSPLHAAVINQPMDVIEILVDFGMNPNVANKVTGETPLHTATAYGRLPAMEGLMLKGGIPDVKDKNNRMPEDLARTEDLKQTMLSYSSLYAALKTGFVQATGMQITPDSVTSPLHIDRVGLIIESIDLPKEFPTTFYCRRERSENSSVPVKTQEEEYVCSDVFHVQVSDVMRDVKTRLHVPIYGVPPKKEEMVLRFLGHDEEDKVIDKIDKIDNVPHCLIETTLIPETTCVCLVFTRPKQEDNTVPADGTDGTLITSRIEENFQLEVPPETFQKHTKLSLKVYDSNVDEAKEKQAKNTSHSTSLLTDVFQVNVSDTAADQPKKPIKMQMPNVGDEDLSWDDLVKVAIDERDQPHKPIKMQLPTIGDGDLSGENLVIVAVDENNLENSEYLPEVVNVVPTVINTNIVFEVSHFSIYVPVPKAAIATEEDLLSLKRQISDCKNRRKPANFMAMCKQDKGRKHTLLVDCGPEKRTTERTDKWMGKGYEKCDNCESKMVMLAPGDSFFVDVKGNATFESRSNSMKRKLVFSQFRSSFQAFAIQLDKGVFRPEDANVDIVIYKKDGRQRVDVFTLNVQLHIPPPASVEQAQDVQFDFLPPSNCTIGEDMNVGVMIRNATTTERTFSIRMTLSTIDGTNVTKVKEETFETTVEAKTDEQCMMLVQAKEYQVPGAKHSEFNMTTHCTVVETNELFISVEKFALQKPALVIECDDNLTVNKKSTAKLSFRNSTNLTLHGAVFNVNANFVADVKKLHIKKDICSGELAAVDIPLVPRRVGKWPITANFSADEMSEVTEVKVINVTK